jgi:Tfp pilus assembly protein PilP
MRSTGILILLALVTVSAVSCTADTTDDLNQRLIETIQRAARKIDECENRHEEAHVVMDTDVITVTCDTPE